MIVQEAYTEDRSLYTDRLLNQLLSALYQLDVLEEATINEWAKQPVTSPDARQALTPFLTWLQQAEEEDEDEDEWPPGVKTSAPTLYTVFGVYDGVLGYLKLLVNISRLRVPVIVAFSSSEQTIVSFLLLSLWFRNIYTPILVQ